MLLENEVFQSDKTIIFTRHYTCSDNTRFDANQLPDVFEDELEQESPESTLSRRRDRHDSGYVPGGVPSKGTLQRVSEPGPLFELNLSFFSVDK